MSDEVIEMEDEVLVDIRDVLIRDKSSTQVLDLTDVVEEGETEHAHHNNVLKDISNTLDSLDEGENTISNIRRLMHKIKENKSSQPRSNQALEELVLSMLEPKIEQWIDKNLASIVRSAVEKEIKNIMHEDDI